MYIDMNLILCCFGNCVLCCFLRLYVLRHKNIVCPSAVCPDVSLLETRTVVLFRVVHVSLAVWLLHLNYPPLDLCNINYKYFKSLI